MAIIQHSQGILSQLCNFFYFIISRFSQKTVQFNGRKLVVQSVLGQGGFGEVLLVSESKDSKKLYALKCIRVQLPEHESRVMNEINAHERIIHDNVLKLLEYQLVKENDKLVMGRLLLPYYPNGTVQDLIDRVQTIEIDQTLSSNHGLAYRDLKPDNILIGDHTTAVLMDLGSTSISRTKISNRKDSVALADFCAETVTAPFRAPELFDPFTGSEINESTDAWALGCTIYAMTYGESPFDGSMTAALSGKVTFPDQAHSHINWLITDILKVNADLRPGITEILAKLEGMSSTRQFSPENA